MMFRSHTCGELTKAQVDQVVVLNGWVHRRRDHGNVIFIDLRDRFGLTQIVFNPESSADAHQRAHVLRGEYVVSVRGMVKLRPEGSANPDLSTGDIEVFVQDVDFSQNLGVQL